MQPYERDGTHDHALARAATEPRHHTLARAATYAIACALVLGVVTGALMRVELATTELETSPEFHAMSLALHRIAFAYGLVPQVIAAIFGVRLLPTLLGRDGLAGLSLAGAGLLATLLGMAGILAVRGLFDAGTAMDVDVVLGTVRLAWGLLGLGELALGLCLVANGWLGRARLLAAPLVLGLALLGVGLVLGGGITLATALSQPIGEFDDTAATATWLEFGGVALVVQGVVGQGDARPAAGRWFALALLGLGVAALLDRFGSLAWDSPATMSASTTNLLAATLGALALLVGAWLQLRARPLSASPLRTFFVFYVLAFVLRSFAGAYLATLSVDVHLHDTYFVHAIDHLRAFMTLGLALPIGVLWCWPLLATEQALRPSWWRGSAWLSGVSLLVYCLLAAWLGDQGMPRRYITYLPEYAELQRNLSLVTVGVLLGPLPWIVDIIRASWSARTA